MFYGKTARLIYVVPSLLYTISFCFLLSALYTIRKVMKSLTDLVIIYEVFIFYAATALLAIIGQLPVIVVGIDGNLDGKKYSSITIMNNIIIFIFQLCLILIFNKLISVAIEQKNNLVTGRSLSNYSATMSTSNVQSDNLLRSTTEPD